MIRDWWAAEGLTPDERAGRRLLLTLNCAALVAVAMVALAAVLSWLIW